MDFWMLRVPKGCRLSNPKRRKAAKIHSFGRVRIILDTLLYILNLFSYLFNLSLDFKDTLGYINILTL